MSWRTYVRITPGRAALRRKTATMLARPKITFVLSAGRTGTVFLSRLLAEICPDAQVVHEPFPSRYELLLGNMANDLGVGRSAAKQLFRLSRQRYLRRLSGKTAYVEINPMLCPIADSLAELPYSPNVVHLTRSPLSWAHSMTKFKASRRFRPVIDFIPFSKPYPSPRPPGWLKLTELERQLWRWRYCNERILQVRTTCRQYTRVRYEELFASSADVRRSTAQMIVDACQLSPVRHIDPDHWQRVNPAPHSERRDTISEEKVREVCGNLMSEFGYV